MSMKKGKSICHHISCPTNAAGRRLLYVACTRAQTLLYIVYARERAVGGKKKDKRLSAFVSIVKGKNEVRVS